MKIKLFYFLLYFSFYSFGQGKTDLLKKINNYKNLDTVKVEMIIDYCVSNTFSNTNDVFNYANQAFHISNKINYKKGKIRALNCIGNYYYQQANYNKAVSYYNEALSNAEKNKDIQNKIIGLSNLASLYTRIHQEAKAINLFKTADSLLIKSGDRVSQNRAAILTNTGMAYSALNQHQKAIKYHLETLKICEIKNIRFGIALSKSNIGEEFIRLKKYDISIPFLIDAMQISENEGYNNFLGQIYKNLGEIYLQKKNNSLAIQYFNKAVFITKKINDQNQLLFSTKLLYETYYKEKDFKNAFLNSVEYSTINENIYGTEKQKYITEINTRYETEKKVAQIKELSQKKKISELESNKKSILINSIVISFLALALLAYFLFSRFKEKKKNELLQTQLIENQKRLEAEKKATDSELKALKSQMNPHFIFNALSGIQDQFMYGDKSIANEQMGNFTYLTRQILSVSGKKQILLSTEIDILNKYLELEKMRFKTNFEYEINLLGNIDEDYHEIPPMLLQPFVENSIKHGLMHKSGLKTIAINFDLSSSEDYLICTIIDNGIGRQKSAEIKAGNLEKHNSFSTKSIQQRLELLNDNLQLQELIVYSDLLENDSVVGTKVVVHIPLV